MIFPIISTRIHAYIDYVFGALLLASPWLFGFSDSTNWGLLVPVVAGSTVIVYSICTKYELGPLHAIPMRAHLTVDLLMGLALAVSPWAIGFAHVVWWPHLTFGLFAVVSAIFTVPVSKSNGFPNSDTDFNHPHTPAAV